MYFFYQKMCKNYDNIATNFQLKNYIQMPFVQKSVFSVLDLLDFVPSNAAEKIYHKQLKKRLLFMFGHSKFQNFFKQRT